METLVVQSVPQHLNHSFTRRDVFAKGYAEMVTASWLYVNVPSKAETSSHKHAAGELDRINDCSDSRPQAVRPSRRRVVSSNLPPTKVATVDTRPSYVENWSDWDARIVHVVRNYESLQMHFAKAMQRNLGERNDAET